MASERTHLLRRGVAAALALLLAAGPAFAGTDYSGDGGVSPFYRWDGKAPSGPGRLLRREPLEPAFSVPGAARAERLLYSSAAIDGDAPIVVSGALFLPAGKPPKGGWPLVSWAHGTTGVADVCAPSRLRRSPRDARYLSAWLEAGFAVVATDYRGLGTPGVHPYLLYRPEGRDVLDAARAVLAADPALFRNAVLTVGQSQGSGAALGAALLAPAYAPGLHVIGTVATGIVAHVADPGGAPQIPVAEEDGPTDYAAAAFAVMHLLGTDQALKPGIDPARIATPAGKVLLDAAIHHCFRDVVKIAVAHRLSVDAALTPARKPLDALEAARGAFASARIATPVFIGTGLADEAADPRVQYNFVSALCHAGTPVSFHTYPGLSHGATVNASLADSLPFVRHLLRGEPQPGNCGTLRPPRLPPAP